MKWTCQRGRLASQFRMSLVLWVPALCLPGQIIRNARAVANGGAPADLTVTSLTSALPLSWTKQQKKFGVA